MKLTTEQYAQALYEALEAVNPKQHDAVIDNFVKVLQENNDLKRYEQIIGVYERLDRERRGVKDVELTFARETKVNAELLDELNQLIGAKSEVRTKIDESIIGGVIIRVDDTLIDVSTQGQLNRLKNQLIH
jgi:F-type H+-transporting ATPase subunit delta